MTLVPFTPEEWERRKASLLEDVRILRVANDELQATADMLRERGHAELAVDMEVTIFEAAAVADKIETSLAELEEEGL